MSVTSSHTAPGPMGGYLFQPERALYWLACSERNSVIGIETEDDIVRKAAGSIDIYEQDKHSISQKGYPLGDHSTDLWKTLSIWLKAVKEETIDLSKAELHLVTNRFVPDSLLVVQLSQSKDEESIASCLANLRNCGLGVPESVKRYAGEVLSYSDQEIGNLIRKFRFFDGRDATSGSNLKENIISYLHIPEGLPSDQIVHSLLGWIHDTALDYWRAGEPREIVEEKSEELKKGDRLDPLFKDSLAV